VRFEALVDTVESTGADLYAHARIEGGSVEDERIEALVGDAEGAAPSRARDGAPRLVARLDPVTRTRAGARLTLGVDPDRVYLFDAASGDARPARASTTPRRRLRPRHRRERRRSRRSTYSGAGSRSRMLRRPS